MGFKTITKSEIERQRMDSMCRVFERVDRVLAQSQVRVTSIEGGPAPAWSDGQTITFNRAAIDGVTTVEDLIRLNGLNYHELSHILYTPRNHEHVIRRIRNDGLYWAFNILEDQRIETLLTAEYPATIPYFISIIMRYIATEDEKNWNKAFPFTHGRKYLPIEVRRELGKRYEKPDTRKELAAIIDEYRVGVWSQAASQRMCDLVERFAVLVRKSTAEHDPFAHDERQDGEVTQGQAQGSQSQEAAADAAKGDGDDDSEGEGDDEGSGGSGASSDGDKSDDEGKGSGSGSGDEGDDDEDGEGAGSGGDDQDEDEEDGEGAGAGDPTKSGPASKDKGKGGKGASKSSGEDLRQMVERAVAEVEGSQQVQQEIADVQRAVKDHTTGPKGYRSSLPDHTRYPTIPVSPEMTLAAKRFGQEIGRLQTDLDPGFKTHQSSGKLNLRRSIEHVDYDTAFDVWESGINDATELEVVIMVDQSSSMNSNMPQVSQALWVIKRGIESAAPTSNVTVIGYGDKCHTLVGDGAKEHTTKYRDLTSGGGTCPLDGLVDARMIFGTTRKHRAVLITLTDGFWTNDAQECDETIQRIQNAGVTTALAFLEPYPGWWNSAGEYQQVAVRHGCEIFSHFNEAYDLINFAKSIVKSAMKKGA